MHGSGSTAGTRVAKGSDIAREMKRHGSMCQICVVIKDLDVLMSKYVYYIINEKNSLFIVIDLSAPS